jgi:Na+/proline symporter
LREFRRSARFGLIGVFVVAAIVVVIALTADSTDPNPKLQLGLIFGVIAAFIAVLLFVQPRTSIERPPATFEGTAPEEPLPFGSPRPVPSWCCSYP